MNTAKIIICLTLAHAFIIGGTCCHHAAKNNAAVQGMVFDAIVNAENLTTAADCESAERVLTAYAAELTEKGASKEEIKNALRELAAEY